MILDLFAGPGGWSEGLHHLGLAEVGVEWDVAACRTAMAAGHLRVQADVATLPTGPMVGKVTGLIGSPPCTMFSSAGHGTGTRVVAVLRAAVVDLFSGRDTREYAREAIRPVALAERRAANAKRSPHKQWTDAKVEQAAQTDAFICSLVLEPARFVHDIHPEWVALEQVPEVLPLWQTYAVMLRNAGYSVWTGVLNSANYGIPQTRERAILIASRVRTISPPRPTYAKDGGADDLFGESLTPWVSMADALGWGVDRPSQVVTAGGGNSGGPEPFASRAFRDELVYVNGNQTNAARRPASEPAPTVMFGYRSNNVRWERFRSNQVTDSRTGGYYERTTDRPAPTITTNVNSCSWIHERPATTVVGSFRPDVIAAPGYRTDVSRQDAPGSVRVTVQEAAILQSFRPDYPWQGSRTKQYEQVGNAIPPRLAAHCLAEVIGLPVPTFTAAVARAS